MELELITSKQLAEILGITPNCVSVWVRQGKIPQGIKIGHARRWRKQQILDWVKANEN